MTTSTELLAHPDDIISTTTKLALSYKQSLDEHLLSQSEYDELIKDLLDLKRLNEFALSEERKQQLFTAFLAIAGIIGVAGSFVTI